MLNNHNTDDEGNSLLETIAVGLAGELGKKQQLLDIFSSTSRPKLSAICKDSHTHTLKDK